MLLPIHAHEKEILEAIRANQTVIVVGETGSGKTTCIPQFLYQTDFAGTGIIGITEPRKIAAISTAKFVANELGVEFSQEVGSQVRFDHSVSLSTKIKFMTDGILLREIQEDPDLKKYSVIMVDEAHERSINIDFTLGLLKDLLKRRSDLKIIVASATIDSEKFSKYFNNAPVINVSGRTYPVDIFWLQGNIHDHEILDETANTIAAIHQEARNGDILVFLPGEEEINEVEKSLEKLNLSGLTIFPLYGMLPWEKQQEVFKPINGRKVILATNIAETSITIDGIVYVVDSGLIKQMSYDPISGISSLDTVKHSRAGCDQRAGRAGRTQSGTCFRLYTEENYQNRREFTEPEIMRSSLASVVLSMEDIGIKNIKDFDFVDCPDRKAFNDAYEMLTILGAIQEHKKGLTQLGRRMAALPLAPHISRMVLEAEKHGCVQEVATIAAFLSVKNVFFLPRDEQKRNEANWKHMAFKVSDSDAQTFLKIWNNFQEYFKSGFDEARTWTFDNFLNFKALLEVRKIRDQLIWTLNRNGIEITSCENMSQVDKAVAAGLIHNLAEHMSRGSFNALLRDMPIFKIHPGSALFQNRKRLIVTTEIINTSAIYGRNCVSVKPEWLPELVPSLSRYNDLELLDWDEFAQKGIVKTRILFQDREIATTKREISLAEAKIIQDRMIAEATEKKWRLLSFTLLSEDGILSIYRINETGLTITPYREIKEGIFYYCGEERFLGENRIEVKFGVFNLGADANKSADSKSANRPTRASLEELKKIFNNK